MSAPERGQRGTWQYLAFWDNGALDIGRTQAALPSLDLPAALLIAAEEDGGLHYAQQTDKWYRWDGRCHQRDESGSMNRLVVSFAIRLRTMLETVRPWVIEGGLRGLAPDASQTARNKAAADAWAPWLAAEKYAAGLHRTAGANALLGYLVKVCGCSHEDMDDRQPGLLNFPNGTLDLATLQLRPHRKADLITYCLPDPWDARADCPRFRSLAWHMCGEDWEVYCYFLKCLGYALLGDNREQKIFFISGPTGSGKSQALFIVSQVLGPLAHRTGAELITVVRQGRNARKENSVRGKRFVTITETSQWMNIDEAQLKRLTGEPVISVDKHYATEELPTIATWTIFVATNEMPNLTNFDEAMRRRIVVIPGGHTIEAWMADTQIATKILGSERQGITALLARSCAEYFRSGLEMPGPVQWMTAQYAHQQDTVGSFMTETMVSGGYGSAFGLAQSEVWQTYQKWSSGSARLGRNTFMERMGAQPGVTWNKTSRRFEGIAWSSDWAARVV